MKLAFVDQGHTGEGPAEAADAEGIELHVGKLPEAKKGFMLLLRRWVVECSFGWVNRFQRLAGNYEGLREILAGLHFGVFSILMLGNTPISTSKFITRSSDHRIEVAAGGGRRR